MYMYSYYLSISETVLHEELVKSDLHDWTGLYDTSGHISSLYYILVEIWVVAFAVKNRQEVYGQHPSPEKQFKSINTLVQTIIIPSHWLVKKKLYIILKNWMVLYLYNFEFHCKNKRPMGHIAHLREKSSNDYIITLIRRRKNPLLTLWEFIGSSFEETWIPFTQGCFCQDCLKLAQLFWRRFF